MIHYFVKQTDNFICSNLKKTFETLELNYKQSAEKINLYKELENLEFDPFVNTSDKSSSFENAIKSKLKILIGIFFVFIPLVILLPISYILDLQFTYAFLITFLIAIFASSRTSVIATRYSDLRHS